MKKIILPFLLLVGFLSNNSNLKAQSISSAVVPQYAKGNAGATVNTARVPLFIWAKLTGFSANTTYRYGTRAVRDSVDGPTSKGAGNQIFVHQSGGNTYTSQYGLKTVGQYDSLTTDNSGEYSGWFGAELTGNTRFTDGNYIKVRLILNDGTASGTTETYFLTTADSIKCLDFSTSSGSGCSSIFSHTQAADKNFAFLFDNVSGSGRPLSIALIEQDDLDYRTVSASSAAFYKNNVDSISGAWGTIIPNNLSNGVRRIENHKLSDGSLFYANTDADGVWTTGSINTVNPAGGSSAIEISGADDPLIPSNKKPIIKFSAITANIGEGAGTTSVTIDISAAPANGESVSLVVKGGSATDGTDYSLVTNSAAFAAGVTTSQSITINITDDNLIEGKEDIVLALRNASSGLDLGTDSIITITINDNDSAVSIKFSNTSTAISEGVGTTSVTINISAAPANAESVSVFVKGGTATNGTDYSLVSNSASFAATSTSSQSITINITDDMLAEGAEDIVLALRNPSSGIIIGTDSIITITINDNDVPNVSFAKSSASVKEDADTVWMDIKLANPDPNNATKVDVALTGGTASNGSDITTYNKQTVTFPAGSTTTQKVWFVVTDDMIDENDETLIFSLQNATNSAQITNGTNTITIIDNDTTIIAAKPIITFKITSDSVTEGNNASISVSISSADTANDVTVDVVANGGTAVSGTHYTYTTTKLTFAKGTTTAQNVSVSTKSDNKKSGDQTLLLKLQNASSNATIGTQDIFTLNIKDNGIAGISEVSKLYHIQLMPNPAKDILYVNASEAIEQIRITDINGRIVADQSKVQNTTANIDLQHLQAGIYIIQIKINGQTAVEKLIVE